MNLPQLITLILLGLTALVLIGGAVVMALDSRKFAKKNRAWEERYARRCRGDWSQDSK